MELSMARRRPRGGQPGFEGKREIAPAIVESPYVKGDYEPVIRNVRESSLSHMHAVGTIDDAQLRAGEWFRGVYERTRMGSMAIDPSKEPVDTSGFADPIPDRIVRANEELAAARAELGRPSFWVIELVCGQGFTIKEAAQAAGGVSNRDRERFVGWLLRLSLDALAVWKGFAKFKTEEPKPCPYRGRG